MLRWITAGESHGPALVAVLDGLPAGIAVTTADLGRDLARRRLGYGRGARMKFEQDEVELTGGVRLGLTMGGPVAVRIGNSEWPKWQTVMSADPVDAEVLAEQARNAPLTRPRPGHADLAGMQKYDVDDARPILERASARETAARVALGAVAKAFLRQALGVEIVSHVVGIGSVSAPAGVVPRPQDADRVDESEVRCFDGDTSAAMIAEIDEARRAGDTLGGVVEVIAYGLPPGLGSHTHGDRRLDARLAGALMGIQAIKGVELGDGFELARIRGSQAHDEIVNDGGVIRRISDRSGGTEGGMTTGEMLRVRAAMKPISTVPRALQTVDTSTGEAAVAINQRSDVVAVPAAAVVAEAMVALVLAEVVLDKFGGDSLAETRRNADAYLKRLVERGLTPANGPDGPPVDTVTPKVVLVGLPGAGKSTTGRRLAKILAVPFADSDDLVEAADGRSVQQIFAESGEDVFRATEGGAVAAALTGFDGVLALGGGALGVAATRDAIAASGVPVVVLRASVDTLRARVGDAHTRPLLADDPAGRLAVLAVERAPVYDALSTFTVETDGRTPGQVAATIAARLYEQGRADA